MGVLPIREICSCIFTLRLSWVRTGLVLSWILPWKLPKEVKCCVYLLALWRNLTECHGMVPPQPYYEACVASGCSKQHPSTECQSMQTYAALCGLHGVCVDWRRQANGQCGKPGRDLLVVKWLQSVLSSPTRLFVFLHIRRLQSFLSCSGPEKKQEQIKNVVPVQNWCKTSGKQAHSLSWAAQLRSPVRYLELPH